MRTYFAEDGHSLFQKLVGDPRGEILDLDDASVLGVTNLEIPSADQSLVQAVLRSLGVRTEILEPLCIQDT